MNSLTQTLSKNLSFIILLKEKISTVYGVIFTPCYFFSFSFGLLHLQTIVYSLKFDQTWLYFCSWIMKRKILSSLKIEFKGAKIKWIEYFYFLKPSVSLLLNNEGLSDIPRLWPSHSSCRNRNSLQVVAASSRFFSPEHASELIPKPSALLMRSNASKSRTLQTQILPSWHTSHIYA